MTADLTTLDIGATLAVAAAFIVAGAVADRWERRRPFQLGTRVRITADPWTGETGKIVAVRPTESEFDYGVKVDDFEHPYTMPFHAGELERIGWWR